MHRSEYLASPDSSHRTYYAQFVTDDVRKLVACKIPHDVLMASKDPHLNDIPLRRWDNMAPAIWALVRHTLAQYGEIASMAVAVCIAKEAARQIIERSAVPPAGDATGS